MKIWAQIVFLLIFIPLVYSKPHFAVSTNGQPKYAHDFTHFHYVNPHAPKRGTLNLAVIGTYNSFNPFVMKGDPAQGIAYIDESYLHACLMARADDEPDSRYGLIAESIEIAPDRTWIDFHLRPQAIFSDGSPILASDVVFTFHTLTTKGLPFFKMYYKAVSMAKVMSPRTVRFMIQDPRNKEIQNVLGQMPILSQKFYEHNDFENDVLIPPVTSGPYRIKSFDPGREVTFERISHWWGDNVPCMKGRFNPKKIRFFYFMDQDVAFEAFKAGKYDLRVETNVQRWLKSYDFPEHVKGNIIKRTFKIPLFFGCYLLVFNTRNAFLSDIRVRQALSLGLDFGKLNKRLFGGYYKRAYSYFEGTSMMGNQIPSTEETKTMKEFATNPDDPMYTEKFRYTFPYHRLSAYDKLVYAQKLLREAGFTNKEGLFVHDKTNQPLEFTILLPRGSPNLIRIVQDYIKNCERIGFKIHMKLCEQNQLVQAQQNFDFDIIYGLSVQTQSPGNEQSDFWSCASRDKKGSRNLAGICSASVDKAIEKVISAKTYPELTSNTKILDRLLLWGFYNLPLWNSQVTFLAHKSKIHFPENIESMNHMSLDTLWIESQRNKE